MANTPQFTMRLDPVLREKLEAIAKSENRSLGNMVEQICRLYIAAQEKKR
jgi:predicted transcriptional regulator